jgi:hypothetical protein
MGTPDLNPKPKTERCSHCKRERHNQERCWVVHPHLRPKRTDRNQAEMAKKRVLQKPYKRERDLLRPEKSQVNEREKDSTKCAQARRVKMTQIG